MCGSWLHAGRPPMEDTKTRLNQVPRLGSPGALELRARAHDLIPGGAHTYAKGDDQWPELTPTALVRGEGCRVWDADGNEFIEYGPGGRTVTFHYNDIEGVQSLFEEHRGEIACVILEAEKTEPPRNDFLRRLQEVCAEHGALFILDETITGFRYHLGGAQEVFGLTPDLST